MRSNTLLGGLINFRVVRANGRDVPEDKLIIDVYRTDPNVEVRWRTDGGNGFGVPLNPDALKEKP